jgi:hypothetical protein
MNANSLLSKIEKLKSDFEKEYYASDNRQLKVILYSKINVLEYVIDLVKED